MKERENIIVNTTPILTQAELDAQMNTAISGVKVEKGVPVYDEPIFKPEMTREQKKARLVSVLERGIVHDRMHIPLPPDKHGEWARKDPLEIARMQTLGFEVDYVYAQQRALHSDGTGAAVVGDVIFMVCDRDTKEIIDEIRHEQFIRSNAPKQSKEEVEFIANTFRDGEGIVPTVSESTTHKVDRDRIMEALRAVGEQTSPAQ